MHLSILNANRWKLYIAPTSAPPSLHPLLGVAPYRAQAPRWNDNFLARPNPARAHTNLYNCFHHNSLPPPSRSSGSKSSQFSPPVQVHCPPPPLPLQRFLNVATNNNYFGLAHPGANILFYTAQSIDVCRKSHLALQWHVNNQDAITISK